MSDNSSFLTKISTFIKDITAYKNNPKTSSKWTNDYEEMLDNLLEIQDLIEFNAADAEATFNQMNLSKYPNFGAYINANSTEARVVKHNDALTPKLTRNSHKKLKCPNCGEAVKPGTSLDEYHCEHCGYDGEIKIKSSPMHSVVDTTKHINKLLDKISGTQKVNKKIINVKNVVDKWITDTSYIRSWLNNQKEMKKKWTEKFNKVITDPNMNVNTYLNRPNLRHIPEDTPSFKEFKLFTDELYNALEYFKKIDAKSSSNMTVLDDATIVEIIDSYYCEHECLPTTDENYEYNGVNYQIGHYFNYLSLIYDDDSYPVKLEIEDIVGKKLTQPGLTCNFAELKSDKNVVQFPKPFHYGQEFSYFIHEIFNYPHCVITPNDRQHIINLINDFNIYYKHNVQTNKNKECNSPMFVCVLSNIIKLTYFKKYREFILSILPQKNEQTVAAIAHEWLNYKMDNYAKLAIYNKEASELPLIQNAKIDGEIPSTTEVSKDDENKDAEQDDEQNEEEEEEEDVDENKAIEPVFQQYEGCFIDDELI